MFKIFGPCRIAAAFVIALALGLSSAARAQEPSAGQIDAARAAVKALHATDDFDGILPNAAAALKRSLIQAEPNLEQTINETVDEQALKLASRRGDLEKEVATIYAKTFSKDELDAIAKFYNSAPGKKLLEEGSNVTDQTLRAAHIWANGIARDLADATNQAIQKKIGKNVDVKTPDVPVKQN